MAALVDRFGRVLDYLRISVTDRCNFRCVYCMPPEGIELIPQQSVLSYEQIARVARNFVAMGGKRIRLTGGEPLMRKDLPQLIRMLRTIQPQPLLMLTTNGSLLAPLAEELKQAGLERINISLDSLDPQKFSSLTRRDSFAKVWQGIEESLRIGLHTKLNVVALRGLSDGDILKFAELAFQRKLEVRFIEFMPLCGTGWHPGEMIPISHVRELLQKHFCLQPKIRGREVAESYSLVGGLGSVGFIASMTESFCSSCSRLRLSSDGKIHPCLFSQIEFDLKPYLTERSTDAQLQAALHQAVLLKPEGHGVRWQEKAQIITPRIRAIGG